MTGKLDRACDLEVPELRKALQSIQVNPKECSKKPALSGEFSFRTPSTLGEVWSSEGTAERRVGMRRSEVLDHAGHMTGVRGLSYTTRHFRRNSLPKIELD